MKRRHFLQLSSASLLAYWACTPTRKTSGYSIEIQSDRVAGHQIFAPYHFPIDQTQAIDYLIVGGGIAGMTTAVKLKGHDFVLCELSDEVGGTASAIHYKDNWLCQGAHYDMAYPPYFGEDVLGFLAGLKLIEQNRLTNYWEFTEKQYLIDEEKEGSTWQAGNRRDDVLEDDAFSRQFLDFTGKFVGKMCLPTRLIDTQYHYLNQITFQQLLQKNIRLTPSLIRAIDYQLRDDFGADSSTVSGSAGLYYYASRPYAGDKNQVFSPPQGNYYFIQKMLAQIYPENILTRHAVRKIEDNKQGFRVEVMDMKAQKIKRFQARKIIYAGQKHALKHIYPQDYRSFARIQYAPWVVLNFVFRRQITPNETWQHDVLGKDTRFLGFINSTAQQQPLENESLKSAFTAYYCLEAQDRKLLNTIAEDKYKWVQATFQNIAQTGIASIEELEHQLEVVFIKVMGHAMPIPTPHYLFQKITPKNPHIQYAGVDTFRLPLFLEAVDSGIQAVQSLRIPNH
jgi:hypothetical protein